MVAVLRRTTLPRFLTASYLLSLAAWALPLAVSAQKEAPITFANSSFEDIPASGQTPNGWYNCGPGSESPPDVQPGQFQVTKAPKHGNTYLGLVVRDNETWEGVAQRLSRPLEQNQCYEMTIELCRSEIYLSQSRVTNEAANYTTPAKLIIWGGNGFCDKREVLYETPLVINTRWNTATLRFHPKKGSYSHIMFEAYYKTPVLFPYNGHILLDNASAIRRVPCEPVIAKKTTPPPSRVKPKTQQPERMTARGTPTKETPPPVKPVATPAKATPKWRNKPLKESDRIRLENLYFDANQFVIKDSSFAALTELYQFMKRNPQVTIEVGGHTNNRAAEKFAMELSTNRAKAVADWLIGRGIPAGRVQFKGYGWTLPLEPNTTEDGRRKNQRVEFKVLKISG
jgi:outer membrane protein OmpA-like peptidoglycan-associated protein